jgi:hypothetical protein
MKLLARIPEQLKRIFFLLIPLVIAFLILRSLLVPEDFGEIGHYRTSAVNEIISQEMKYAGEYICNDCHDDVGETKNKGLHKNLSCEICHGPALMHADDPDSFLPPAPRERGTCPVCHEYLESRPTGFPQIISASHNPLRACIKCHKPHDPVPPETPHECSACHKEIANIKSLSHHALISCRTCHETPEDHKVSPRDNIPSIPQTREFCGQCHSVEAETDIGIPKIDLISHEPKYVCWQCHYPHLPEAK